MTICLMLLSGILASIVLLQQYFWKQDLDAWGDAIDLLNERKRQREIQQ